MNQKIELREHQVNNAKSYELPNEDESNGKINLSKAQFIIIMIGLLFTISVAALDTTIITTSVGVIASDLNGFQDIAWVATAYFLTSNAFQLLYGKFSDIFGRKPTILFALSIFLVGSILCGVAQNIEMLIIARAIAGIGGGGLMTLCTIIISDLVPLKKRGYYMGLSTAIFTASSTLGSILGGVFVLKLSWRWCFYINIPICAIAMLIIIVFFRFPSNNNNFKEKLNRVDYFGCITLLIFTTLLTLALNWGGQTYSWSSAAVLIPLVLSIISMFAFIYLQLKVSKEPIIPSNILVRNVNACGLITFCNGTILFSIIIYIPLYNQIAYQESSLQSTIGILPVICGMIVCSIFSSSIISRTGKYRFFSIIGTLLGLIGSILLTQFISVDVSRTLIYIFTAIVGAGIGLCMQATTIASQAAVGEKDLAVVTSLITFTFSLGGIIGITVLGTIYQNVSSSFLMKYSNEIDLEKLSKGTLYISSLPLDQIVKVTESFAEAFKYMFYAGVAFFAIGFIASLFVEHISLKRAEES